MKATFSLDLAILQLNEFVIMQRSSANEIVSNDFLIPPFSESESDSFLLLYRTW